MDLTTTCQSSINLFLYCLFEQAEELIKHEMLIMLRHDLVHHTPPGANVKKSNMTTLKAELTKKPLMKLTEEEMKEVHIHVHVHVFVLYKCVMYSTYSIHVHVHCVCQ